MDKTIDDKTIDADELIAEINRRLPFDQQVRKDDPMYTGIVLNKATLDLYVKLITKELNSTLNQFTAISEQQVERTETIAERMLSKCGNNIEQQLDVAAQGWEQRLRNVAEETEASIRQVSRLAWISGFVSTLTASVMIGFGLAICHIVFDLVHHTRDYYSHKIADHNLSTHRTQTKLARK
jgi:hypothetical protein